MDAFYRENLKLTECYRGSSNSDEAEEKCKKYAENLINIVNEEFTTVKLLKQYWMQYHKTKNYYKFENI
jgi:hypothetical protein